MKNKYTFLKFKGALQCNSTNPLGADGASMETMLSGAARREREFTTFLFVFILMILVGNDDTNACPHYEIC